MCKNSEFSWSAAILTRRFKVITCLSPICQYLLEQNDHWGPAVQVLIIKLRKQWLTSVPVSQSVVTVKPRDSETGNGNQPSRFFHRLGFSLKKRPYFRLKSLTDFGQILELWTLFTFMSKHDYRKMRNSYTDFCQSLSGYDNELVSLNVSIGEKNLNNKFGIYIYIYAHIYITWSATSLKPPAE